MSTNQYEKTFLCHNSFSTTLLANEWGSGEAFLCLNNSIFGFCGNPSTTFKAARKNRFKIYFATKFLKNRFVHPLKVAAFRMAFHFWPKALEVCRKMAQAPLSKILVGYMIQITTFNVIVKRW